MNFPKTRSSISSIEEIISEIKNQKMVIIIDDENRENEGDLVFPARFIRPDVINFMSHNARGLICVALDFESTERLGLNQMVQETNNFSPQKTAFTVSVEAARGISTGISDADRSKTIEILADPLSQPQDLISPGHIFPIRARSGGVLERAGHTEASVDLCRLASLGPCAVICEIINPDGTMARLPDLEVFTKKYGIKLGSIEDLIEYKMKKESSLEAKDRLKNSRSHIKY